MKKMSLTIIVILLILLFSSCSAVGKKEKKVISNSVSVKTNGDEQIVALKDGEIPIADVLTACGITLNWTNSSTATFFHRGVNYVLDVSNKTIHKEGSSFNYIQIPPGTDNGFIHSADDKLFVDISTMKGVLYMLGIEAILTLR